MSKMDKWERFDYFMDKKKSISGWMKYWFNRMFGSGPREDYTKYKLSLKEKQAIKKYDELAKQVNMYKIDLFLKSNNKKIHSVIIVDVGKLTNKDIWQGIARTSYGVYPENQSDFDKLSKICNIKIRKLTPSLFFKRLLLASEIDYLEDRNKHELYDVKFSDSFWDFKEKNIPKDSFLDAVESAWSWYVKDITVNDRYKDTINGYYVYAHYPDKYEKSNGNIDFDLIWAHLDKYIYPEKFREKQERRSKERKIKIELNRYLRKLEKTFNALVFREQAQFPVWRSKKVRAPNVWLAINMIENDEDWKNYIYKIIVNKYGINNAIKKITDSKKIINSKKLINQIKSYYNVKQHIVKGKKIYTFVDPDELNGIIADSSVPVKYLVDMQEQAAEDFWG